MNFFIQKNKKERINAYILFYRNLLVAKKRMNLKYRSFI